MMNLLEQLTLEHLEGEQRQLAETLGIEAYRRLVQTYSGLAIYVPTLEKTIIPVRDAVIRQEFNGYNYRELARSWNLSEQWVRYIVSDIRQERQNQPPEGQTSLFE